MKNFDLSFIMKLVDRFSNPLKQSMHNFNNFMDGIKKSDTVLRKFSDNMQSIGEKASIYLTAPLALAGGIAVKTAISFESAWTGVVKTVDASRQELDAMKKSLEALARVTPIPQEDIMGIAEAAGQMNIQTKFIPGFTKVMADLAATTNLTTDSGAVALSQFANVMEMSQDKFDRLGSTLSRLDVNSSTSASAIMDLSTYMAGSAHLIKMTEAETLGLAAALASLGVRAELGGGAMSRFIMEFGKEIGTGSKRMAAFAKIAGKPVKELEKLWKTNALEAILTFADGLDKLDKKGKNVSAILDAMKFDGVRLAEVLLKMAGSGDMVKKTIEEGTREWDNNQELLKQVGLRYGTTESKLRIFHNRVRQLASSFGDELLPVLTESIDKLTPLVETLKGMDSEGKKDILGIAAAAIAIGPLLIGLAAITKSISIIAANPAFALIIGSFVAIFNQIRNINNEIDKLPKKIESIKDLFNLAKFASKMNAFNPVAMGTAAYRTSQKLSDMLWPKSNDGLASTHSLDSNLAPSHSKADITIRLQAEQGTNAQIDKVEKDMDFGLKILNDYMLGSQLGYGY